MENFDNYGNPISEGASNWASRRKAFYVSLIFLALFGISYSIFWFFWHEPPSCFDRVKNGDETGIDCGGSCALVCSDSVMQPIVVWDPRLFEVMSGLWSVLVYVENQNTNLDAVYVPYVFTIYDESNAVIEKREGATILPKSRTVGIFEGSIKISTNKLPKRAIFEINENKIIWQKNDKPKDGLNISHGPLLSPDGNPRIEASVKNTSSEEIKNVELVVSVFDGSDNAIAASRTFVENLKKNESQSVFFTWPKPFKLGVKACEKYSNVVLLLDRSGSMASLGSTPPEPLSTARAAAASFVDQLSIKDKIGMISFASGVKEQIDLSMTSDFNIAKQAIDGVNIEKEGTQYTNIYAALHSARQELNSARADEKLSKIVILLTDGVANNPRDPSGKTEKDDIKYAEQMALDESIEIKKEGFAIYTIGLGDNINEEFLKNIASESDNYFYAPSASNLKSIYNKISSDMCEEVPARVEITYKIFGDLI